MQQRESLHDYLLSNFQSRLPTNRLLPKGQLAVKFPSQTESTRRLASPLTPDVNHEFAESCVKLVEETSNRCQ